MTYYLLFQLFIFLLKDNSSKRKESLLSICRVQIILYKDKIFLPISSTITLILVENKMLITKKGTEIKNLYA